MPQRMADVGDDRERFILELHAVVELRRLADGRAADPRSSRRQRDLLRGLQERAVLAQRDQEPQLFQVEPGDDRVEWWGMPGLRKCYSYITCSQLSRKQILQYCEHLRPTKSLRRSRWKPFCYLREMPI